MELEELKKSWNALDEHLKDKEFIKEEELEKLIRHADKGIHAIASLNMVDTYILLLPVRATLDKHEGLRKLILDFAAKGKPIAAICAAPMVLGKLGLLKGKKATCYPSFEQYLDGAECVNEPVVRDGNIITGMGPGAAMEFALTIVDLLVGKEKVDELVEAMCVKR